MTTPTTTTTTCPAWCVTDHDAEAAWLRERDAREGLDFSHDPDSYGSDCIGRPMVGEADGLVVGALLVYNDHDGVRVQPFERAHNNGERDIEALTPAQARMLAGIMSTLTHEAERHDGGAVEPEPLLSIAEAAERLGVKPYPILVLVEAGAVASYSVDGSAVRYVRAADLDLLAREVQS